MAARGRGGGETPERLVKLLQVAVNKTSQVVVANETGLTRLTVQRYIKGIGEPTQATLEKLADYFGVTVSWLRGGESPLDLMESVSNDEALHLAIKSVFPGGEQAVIEELINRGFQEDTAKHWLHLIRKHINPDLMAKSWKISCEDEIIKPMLETIYSCMVIGKDVDKEWFEEAMLEAGKKIQDEAIKPLLNQIFELPTQDIVSISAIIKQYTKDEKFKSDVKQLLNNSVAHSK